MSTVPVTATGMWFLSRKTKPQASRAADGTFALTLFVFDRQGPHTVEPWRVTWSGSEAADYWQLYPHLLQPGVALQMTLGKVRLFRAPGKHADAEFHAAVMALNVLPFADKSAHCLYAKTDSNPYVASINSY